jgi:hypothetical protein
MFHRKCACSLLALLLLLLPAYAEVITLPPIDEPPEVAGTITTSATGPSLPPAASPLIAQLPATPPVVVGTEFARVNWTADFVEATGQAVAPAGKEGTAQGKLLARRGATVDLQRNLLEAIQGVQVDGQTTMTDFMATDVVRTQVQGLIKGVEVFDASWDGEIYTVQGRIRLEHVRGAVLPALPKKPESKPVPPQPGPIPQGSKTAASGLLVDARNVPLIPALVFRILDEDGKEVYGMDFVDAERFLTSGLCDYHTNLGYAQDAPRVAASPIVAQAVRTVSPQNVDIVISNADAAKIRGSSYDFRIPCRVTVVKR